MREAQTELSSLLESDDFGMIADNAAQNVACIDDDLRFGEDAGVIDVFMVRHDNDRVVIAISNGIGFRLHDDASFFDFWNEGIEILDVGTKAFQRMNDIEGR